MIVWIVVGLLASGCSVLPPQSSRPDETGFQDWPATRLGKLAETALAGQNADISGFKLLQSPAQALDGRLALINAAQRSIDLQYHQFQNDRSGGAIMAALVQAAGRGVRVRVLIDDLLTAGEDDVLLSLSSRPNIEVRLFNPFAPPRAADWSRFFGSFGRLDRLNRRMHNKLFVVDNALAISGGRNLADDYLLAPAGSNMIEVDVLSAGPVVRSLTQNFDRYWNSRVVYPIQSLAVPRGNDDALAADWREAGVAAAQALTSASASTTDAATASLPMVSSDLNAGRLALVFGTASAYADPPEKVLGKSVTPAASPPATASDKPPVDTATPPRAATSRPMSNVVAALYDTRSEILIATPYLIPGAAGIVAMRQTLEKHRQVIVLTNSLASSDEPMVHQAYSLYRDDLLRAGARIYELSPSRGTSLRPGSGSELSAPGKLQSRITIVDRSKVYFGSLNLDGRSARANTELGLIVDSPALAAQLIELFAVDRREGVYQVRLTPDSRKLEWVSWQDGKQIITPREPDTSWYERTRLWLSSPFISSDLL